MEDATLVAANVSANDSLDFYLTSVVIMKSTAAVLTTHQSLRLALEGLSSEDVLSLHERIENIALERIEEEERGRMRQERIAEFRELLAKAAITPEELLAFTTGARSPSRRYK
ncbi:hypothetical protein [Aeromonas media]|uniref:H-NS family histone-like protein n=1 Tax=Aeromonas media TaxID=651 RepID=UPI003D0453B5